MEKYPDCRCGEVNKLFPASPYCGRCLCKKLDEENEMHLSIMQYHC